MVLKITNLHILRYLPTCWLHLLERYTIDNQGYTHTASVKDENASECALGISQINCFGNFAMIGAEANSSGSNWDPKTKLDHYIDSKSDPVSVASLKFKIMMQMCQDNQKAMLSGVIDRAKGMVWNGIIMIFKSIRKTCCRYYFVNTEKA